MASSLSTSPVEKVKAREEPPATITAATESAATDTAPPAPAVKSTWMPRDPVSGGGLLGSDGGSLGPGDGLFWSGVVVAGGPPPPPPPQAANAAMQAIIVALTQRAKTALVWVLS